MINWKEDVLPHALVILCFLICSVAYFSPAFSGKVMQQGDTTQFKGMSKEAKDFREKTGEEALWTNSQFGGMPTYQISAKNPKNVTKWFEKSLRSILPFPISHLFMGMLCFYLLMIVLGVNPWLAAIGAFCYSFATYNFLVLEAGHNTKFVAINYMPLAVAAVLYAWRKNWLLGAPLFGLALAMNIQANHVQITYYLGIALLLLFGFEAYRAVKKGTSGNFGKATIALGLASLLAVGANASKLWTTYEYGKETIRGKSELSSNQQSSGGLDKDYAMRWSYGKLETFTLMIPRFYGGGSAEEVGRNSEFFKKTKSKVVPGYWGSMPGTGGPIYVGAIICFLFLFGLIVVDDNIKWWLLAATVLSILLAWGKNLQWFTDIFFYYFPLYNKFRAVMTTMVIAQLAMPALGLLGLHQVLSGKIEREKALRGLYISAGITAGLCLFFALLGGSFFDFKSPGDARYGKDMAMLLEDVRAGLLSGDSFRSFGLIAISAILLFLFLKEKLAAVVVTAVVAVLCIGDLWMVNRRYLQTSDFVSKRKNDAAFTYSAADKAIEQDPEHARVLNMAANTFNEAITSYKHASIGGYHGAKLRRYNELITAHIEPSITEIGKAFQSNPNPSDIAMTIAQQNVLKMLNTKYIIYNPDAPPFPNDAALGNAWFVNDFNLVPNADAEIAAMDDDWNPATTAIIDQRYNAQTQGKTISKDNSGSIKLIDYSPNVMTYESNASAEQLAVFSEIYYNSGLGWNAYVDGQPVDHFRTNYVLRGMFVPEGQHKIEFKFEPSSYHTGANISLISGLLLLLMAGGSLVTLFRKEKTETA